jgi:oxygen-independent coproporphyrinogen-3 oxidase
MIMCDFRLDLVTLSDSFGAEALALAPHLEQIAAGFQPFAAFDGRAFTIHPDGRPLARIMASGLDEYMPDGVRYSRAS